ncbi:transcriptional regulator family: Fungal Specific TF [Aspergillus niger]|nr:transcriptional regulator family: Fungal Specific TF [Aspergillus niger]KAI2883659.1 transcriptional regulator family: Fungal Specific TF [Aspergillus niger]KAI2917753.1 transcriptional regulator family: Fungal Specific TF [Aspergillus niger]KAI2965662.1 transcriptional regulator family: Fungal Specific TF [Aspergillus niger]
MASSTVVLVPGAWHQPSCMRQLQDELTSRGINATTVAHPSIGNTSPPLKTMVDDRASLHAVIEELADKGHYVTVVAHSYGGAVASGAAEGLGVAERRAAGKAGGIVMIVYLVAFVVPKGQTLLGYFGGVAPSFWEFKGDLIYANNPAISDPANLFYNDLPSDVQDYWISHLLPMAAACSQVPNTYEPWNYIPCTYIQAKQDQALPLEMQEKMIATMGSVTNLTLDSSHSPFLSMPRDVAVLVQQAVKEGLAKAPGLVTSATAISSNARRDPKDAPVVTYAPDYPVLDCLCDLQVLTSEQVTPSASPLQLSRFEACRLLEHFYASPNREFHALLIRKGRLLDQRAPRPILPTLLLSILCVACFMPPAEQSLYASERSVNERMAQGRYLLDRLIQHFHPRTLPDTNHVLDDALTAFIMTSIAPSERSVESSLQYWLIFLKFVVQKLELHKDVPDLSEDDKEERRRLWWATYIIDRHAALSFNGRPRITDNECLSLPTPRPDPIWNQPGPLLPGSQGRSAHETVLSYHVGNLDMLGLFLPLSRILGEILEYRFLSDHSTFNTCHGLLNTVQKNILQNLEIWYHSFEALVGSVFCAIAEPDCDSFPAADIPTVAYYGFHMYHCMFVLLHGPMDVVRMYQDLTWQSSSDFLTAGEHAVACANIARHILRIDPQLSLMYRFFGTYFLQSSFIFLILAQKLGKRSDDLILRNCSINLQVLDMFVAATNMDYQRTFAKLLRRALSVNMAESTGDSVPGQDQPTPELTGVPQSPLDPEMLRYRWAPGYTGLWVGPMG